MRELILGGARSGKSALAGRRAEAFAQVVWIATAEARDAEMAERIARHRAERPAHWQTVEEPLSLAAALRRHAGNAAGADVCLVVDCLTLWLTNLLLAEDAGLLERETAALLDTLPALPGAIVLVANEVGLGIVPENALARRFRDEAGRLNQRVAAACERVTFVAAGLPLVLK